MPIIPIKTISAAVLALAFFAPGALAQTTTQTPVPGAASPDANTPPSERDRPGGTYRNPAVPVAPDATPPATTGSIPQAQPPVVAPPGGSAATAPTPTPGAAAPQSASPAERARPGGTYRNPAVGGTGQ